MGKKILVVDDEPNNLLVMKGILSKGGYELSFAKDGSHAVQGAKQNKPDLILLDVMMPGMDGFEVCHRLKQDVTTSHIPVIFVTARGHETDEKKGFDLGAVDYIAKPVRASLVLARVATHLSLVRVEELEELAHESIAMLGGAGHFNDTDTGLHIWRMASYAKVISEAAGWDVLESNMIEMAAPMHDTGKIGIPDAILKAPRKLTTEEWSVMKSHSQIGYDILCNSKHPVMVQAAEIALSHHERWDGNGYPNGLTGEAIPKSARIVAIADVFDALTMKRPYKEPWSNQKAIDEIAKSAGTQFDPMLVELFLGIQDQILEFKSYWESQGI